MGIPKGGIAFFDSGIGGLTVLAACEKYLHGEVVYYYGDNGHAPYGNLSPKKIRRLVFKVFRKFCRLRVRVAVIACNTVTAICIEQLRKKYKFPIIGAEPAIYSAAKRGGQVWILATQATCKSERFSLLCERAKGDFKNTTLTPVPCEHLAGEIEKNLFEQNHDYTILLPKGTPNSIVLGCTHYIYIEEKLKEHYQCEIFHGNEGIARRLSEVLSQENGKNREERPPVGIKRIFLGFLTTMEKFLSKNVQKRGNTNKSFPISAGKPLYNKGRMKIYFLGKYGKNNEKIYKKTFVCGILGESGSIGEKSGQKSQN